MLDKENFIYSDTNLRITSESTNGYEYKMLQNFLEDYYAQTSDVPKVIIVPTETENAALIQKLILDRFHKNIKITMPKRGKALKLLKLSHANAQEYLKNYLNEKAGYIDKIQRGLSQLREILNLPKIPRRIEGFDISNIQGTNPVGSMVVFEDGLPKKSEYRKFKIQSKDTPDDFAMMREMLERRTQHITHNKEHKAWPMPDLMVIDGGKGQLNAALEALQALDKLKVKGQMLKVPLIGLAKKLEEIFLPGKKEPLILSHDQPGLQLLQRLRDEAHRFGITFHRQLRSKQATRSALDEIVGVGPKTKKLLKQNFGTVAEIKKASLDTLTKIIGKKLAKTIKNNL